MVKDSEISMGELGPTYQTYQKLREEYGIGENITDLVNFTARIAQALNFYATSEVMALKKVGFDDGHGDCSPDVVIDHGELAKRALGLI